MKPQSNMNDKILFEEKQRFTQWWLLILLGGINGFFFFGIFKQLILGVPFGNRPMNTLGLIFLSIVFILFFVAFLLARLETIIKNDGIYVRYFPFHLTYRLYNWESIRNIYVKKYSPFWEYGGWGIKYGVKGKVYNTSGNMGLKLEFTNNDTLLIGTHKAIELEELLENRKKK
jgi:hypothetical protein